MRKITKKEYQNRLNEKWEGQEYEVLDFVQMNQPVVIKCCKCGEEVKRARASDIFNNKYGACSKCYKPSQKEISRGPVPISQEELQERLDKIFPPGTYTILKSSGVRNPVTIRCNSCGEIIKRPSWDHMERQKTLCSCHNTLRNNCHSIEEVQSRIDELFGENNFKVFAMDRQTNKITVRHSCGFSRVIDRQRFYESGLCPRCDRSASRGEVAIANFLLKHNIPFEAEKSFPDLVSEKGVKLRFDFFVAEKFIIEFNGPQHEAPTEFFGGEETFERTQKHDKMKRDWAEANGYPLLDIPYGDLKNVKNIIIDFLKFNDYPLGE